MELEGRVCVVTGGSSGLGRATVLALRGRGARVANFDIRPPVAGPASGETFLAVDVTDEARVVGAVRQVVDDLGGLDVCVNCAGMVRSAPVVGEEGVFPIDLFRRTLEVNLTGAFIVLSRAAEQMIRNTPGSDGERGVIINTASIAAMDASSSAAYAASKGGLVSLTLTAARDLARYGIRINAIAPGFMDTEMFASLDRQWVEQLVAKTQFPKRLGQPDEFAELVCHIVQNRFLNASVIRFDAGARV